MLSGYPAVPQLRTVALVLRMQTLALTLFFLAITMSRM